MSHTCSERSSERCLISASGGSTKRSEAAPVAWLRASPSRSPSSGLPPRAVMILVLPLLEIASPPVCDQAPQGCTQRWRDAVQKQRHERRPEESHPPRSQHHPRGSQQAVRALPGLPTAGCAGSHAQHLARRAARRLQPTTHHHHPSRSRAKRASSTLWRPCRRRNDCSSRHPHTAPHCRSARRPARHRSTYAKLSLTWPLPAMAARVMPAGSAARAEPFRASRACRRCSDPTRRRLALRRRPKRHRLQGSGSRPARRRR